MATKSKAAASKTATKTKPAKSTMKFEKPTIIQKSPTVQIHVGVSEFNGETRLDIREFRIYGENTEFGPTKQGISLTGDIADAAIAAMQKHRKEMPRRVVDIDEGIRFVIGKTAEDAIFHKKHVYATEEEAREKTPPDNYKLFRVKIEEGTVVRKKTLAKRVDGEWTDI
jgi:hypothetical protein